MSRTIPLGRVAGIELGANWTWLVVYALVVVSLAVGAFPAQSPGLAEGAYWAMAAVAATAFFASIVLHELGHALQARREDVEIEGITLWLLGGVARFRSMYATPGAELRVALAGPAVTLVIAGALLAIAWSFDLPEAVDTVVVWLGYINAVLLVFNLLPALPLDGGRVLHAILWRVKGEQLWATRVASAIGVGFGALLMVAGVLAFLARTGFGGLWLAFIGWFLTFAARAEAAQVTARQALSGLRVRDVMSPDPVGVPPGASLEAFVEEFATSTRFTTYPVVEDGRPLGLLPFERVAQTPREQWSSRRVRELMVPRERVAVLAADQDAVEALEEVGGDTGRALVVADSRLVGVVSPTDLARAVQLRQGERGEQASA